MVAPISYPARHIGKNPGAVRADFLPPIRGPIHVHRLVVQHTHENRLHRWNNIHALHDSLEEALLLCTSPISLIF